MVVVIDRRLLAREMPHGRRQAAFELIIVIRIQQIMFPVVLVLHHPLGCGQQGLELAVGRLSGQFGAIGITAPGQIGLGQIAIVPPTLFIDQGLQPGTIGPGFGAEHPRGGQFRVQAEIAKAGAIGEGAGGQGILLFRFIQRRDLPGGAVE